MQFIRWVEIRAIRFYVDYGADESYTPTRVQFFAGSAKHNMLPFADMTLPNPKGWQDVPLRGAGGGKDGNSLWCMVLRMVVLENHQNGKDTHIRGFKIYGFDDGNPLATRSLALGGGDDAGEPSRHADNKTMMETSETVVASGAPKGKARAMRQSAVDMLLDSDDSDLDRVEREQIAGSNETEGEQLARLPEYQPGKGGLTLPDFMKDPEIR